MSTVQMIVGGVGLLTYGLFILYFLLRHGWNTLDRTAEQSGRLANARGMEKWFSRLALVTAVCMVVYFGGAKPSGGSRGSASQASSRLTSAESVSAVSVSQVGASSGGTYCYDLLSGESFGPITCPTNLAPVTDVALFGVSPSATSVWLGVAWPCDAAGTDGQLDVYANWRCVNQGWKRFAEIDVSAAHSNVVAELDWPRALDEAVSAGEWPTNATSAAGFFQAAIDRDTDGDGISDGDEKFVLKTNPLLTDTDGDGDDDYWEIDMGFDPRVNEPGISPSCVPANIVTNTSTAANAPLQLTTSSADGEAPEQLNGEWPQIAECSDGNAPAFSNAWAGTFVPDQTGYYRIVLAADDDATLTVGDCSVSVTWDAQHGAAVTNEACFKRGKSYSVSVTYKNRGGPYFLTTGCELVRPIEYNPKIVVDPRMIPVTLLSPDSVKSPVVRIDGELDPDVHYSIEVKAPEGFNITTGTGLTDIQVVPDLTSTVWKSTGDRTVVYTLFADGKEKSSASCMFRSQPPKEDTCVCTMSGTDSKNGCVEFTHVFGSTPRYGDIPGGYVLVRADMPRDSLYTPECLRFVHPMMRRMTYRRNLDAVIVDGIGNATEYRRGLPAGSSAGAGGQLFRDEDGAFVEELPDGLRVIYTPTGEVAALQPRFGSAIPVDELGIAVTTNAQGWITSVVSEADGVMTTAVTGTNAWRLVWSSTQGVVAKTFDFGGDGETYFTLHEQRGSAFGFDYRWTFNPASCDWSFDKGYGTADAIRDERELLYDAEAEVWHAVQYKIDAEGNTNSCASTVLDRNGHTLHATERRDGTTGQLLYSAEVGEDGRIASDTNELGQATSYQYDSFGRLTAKTTVAAGVPTETVEYEYTDDYAPYESRPVACKTYADDVLILDEAMAYGVTASGQRTKRHVRTAGGVTRVSYEVYDALSRLVLSAAESGRARMISYADTSDGGWTETEDTGVWSESDGFVLVPGQSLREVREKDAKGDVVRLERQALVGDDWELLGWEESAYDAGHRKTATEYSDGTNEAAEWICLGPVWTRDRTGIVVSNAYNGAKNKSVSTRYGAFGPVTTRYGYDCEGRVVSEVTTAENCETQTVTRAYDSRGRVTSETDAHGATTTYGYSSDDRVTTVTFADGGTRVTTVNPDGSTASVTGTAVTSEHYTYGVTADGLKWTCIRYGRSDSPRYRKTYVNGFGETVRVEQSGFNGATLVTENAYNCYGDLITRTETGKPAAGFDYDLMGNCTNTVLSVGSVWRSEGTVTENVVVDGLVCSRATTVRACSDATVAPLVESQLTQLSGLSLACHAATVATDVRGNETLVTTAVDPTNATRIETIASDGVLNIATNWYTDGVMVSNLSQSAVLTRRAYDARRRETCRTDGRGNVTRSVYGPDGWLAAEIACETSATRYAHDAMGRRLAVTNALGGVTEYAYDACGRKTYEGGATYPVRYAYDTYGNRIAMTTYRDESGTGDTTTWTYDEASGLLTAKTYADGHGPTYTYTADGKLATRTWARGVVTTYAYDGWGNLTAVTYSDGTPSVTYTYDAMGRQTAATDAAGTTTFAYDDYGEILSETWGGFGGRVLTRHRDAYGRNAGYSVAGVRKTTLGYDAATGRLATMDAGGQFAWSYLAGSDLKQALDYPNGARTEYTYEPSRDLLTNVRNAKGGTVYSNYAYANDDLGRRTAKNNEQYGYNVRSELTAASGDGAYAYQYDDIGNRVTASECGTNSSYTANNLNQYTQITNVNLNLQPQPFVPSYDLDGNQTLVKTSTGVWHVTYNGENRPVCWSNGTTVVTMDFDRMGRRTYYRETENGQQVTFTRFLYDGYLMIQQLFSNSPYNVYKEFVWDPTENVATKPLCFRQYGQADAYLMHDGNKNVTDVIAANTTATQLAHYEYAPFGAVTAATGTRAAANPYRFSSECADDTLGLVYYNYRHYEPMMGRWLQRDPLGEGGMISLCLFLGNAPSHNVDRAGLDVVCTHKTDGVFLNDRGIRQESFPISSGKGNAIYAAGKVELSDLSIDICCKCLPEYSGRMYELVVQVKSSYSIRIVKVGSRALIKGYGRRTQRGYDRTLEHENLHVKNIHATMDAIYKKLKDGGTGKFSRAVCGEKRKAAVGKLWDAKNDWNVMKMNESAHSGAAWDEWKRTGQKTETDPELW